jgi:fructoselysine-6-P-deglycase FrlB-like protein
MSTRTGYPRRRAKAERVVCRGCGYSYEVGHFAKHLRESAYHRAARRRR